MNNSKQKYRHAKNRKPGNLIPGHFWREIQTFLRNKRFLLYLSKFVFILRKSGLNDFQYQYIHA